MKNKDILVSVIVPVYNVEDYLKKCYYSIKKNTYKNLEIILVDDGATDSCPELCDELKKNDSRVKVIHKKNGGLSSARNAGLTIAEGDYVSFIDSDDYIKKDMIEKLVEKAVEYDADIVQCGYCKVDENGVKLGNITCKDEFLDNNTKVLDAFFKTMSYQVVVWNKLYKREILKKIRFVEGKNNEDNMFEADILPLVNKVYLMNYVGYMYLQRASSIMGSCFSPKKMDSYYAYRYMINRADKNYPSYVKYIHNLICLNSFYLDFLIYKGHDEKKYASFRKAIRKEFNKNWALVKDLNIIAKKDRMRLNIYSRFPKAAFEMYRVFLMINKIKPKI